MSEIDGPGDAIADALVGVFVFGGAGAGDKVEVLTDLAPKVGDDHAAGVGAGAGLERSGDHGVQCNPMPAAPPTVLILPRIMEIIWCIVGW